MNARKPNEEGQVLVIIVVSIIALLSFVALAVDGGLAYVDRRAAQNAADAGALAGAWQIAYALESDHPVVTYSNWNCGLPKLDAARGSGMTTAIGQVDINHYTIDTDISDQNGVTTQCYEVDEGSFVDKYIEVTVQVSSGFDTSFAQLIGTTAITNTVTAVTRIRPRTELAFGYALVSLNPNNCQGNQNGAMFQGNGDSYVTGGGIFSNGCLKANGSAGIYTDKTIGYVNDFEGNGSLFNPAPDDQEMGIPNSAVSIPAPNCSGLPAGTVVGNTYQPGIYSSISISNGTWDFAPGLYCITNSGNNAFRINGGTITGDEVTFYLTQGSLTFNGNADINFSAPTSAIHNPAIQGVLFYAAHGNTSAHTFDGNSNTHFVGTIYAPDGEVELVGTNGTGAYQSQIIAWDVFVSGNADLEVVFSPNQNYQTPSLLNLQH